MWRSNYCLCLFPLALTLGCLQAASPSRSAGANLQSSISDPTYDQWIADYLRSDRVHEILRNGPEDLLLSVGNVPEKYPLVTGGLFQDRTCPPGFAYKAWADGLIVEDWGPDGSQPGAWRLPPAQMCRLVQLCMEIPDDNRVLPKPGRRVVVKVRQGKSLTVRVFDRANLPGSVLEALQMMHSRMPACVPSVRQGDTPKRYEGDERDVGADDEPTDQATPKSPAELDQQFYAARAHRMLIGQHDGTVELWDTRQNWLVSTLENRSTVLQVAFSPDQTLVAAATVADGSRQPFGTRRIQIWSLADGKRINQFRPYEMDNFDRVGMLRFSSDNRYLLGLVGPNFSSEMGIAVWDIKAGRHLIQLVGDLPIRRFAFTPDQHAIVAATGLGIEYWPLSDILEKAEKFRTGR